jgi:hypothetical protein
MPSDGIKIAAQALQSSEVRVSETVLATAPPVAGSAQLSAAEYQARLKLKETPLNPVSDFQALKTRLEQLNKPELPEGFEQLPEFEAFVEQFFRRGSHDDT